MFNFFKQDKESKPNDVKTVRESLLQFIKEQLQKAEGGEGGNIKGLQLLIACAEGEKHMYEAATYFEDEGRFKNEDVQKIADDYAIDLPEAWTLDILFTDTLPADAVKAKSIAAALRLITYKQQVAQRTATAYITVLNGEAEQEQYTITSHSGKINIGREKKVQAGDGFYRINTIAFPANSSHESNKFVSRQHAHIEWSGEAGAFLLYADEGGVPPRNKIKVRSEGSIDAVKLHTTQIGYPLQNGDQIILGDSALLQFRYSATES